MPYPCFFFAFFANFNAFELGLQYFSNIDNLIIMLREKIFMNNRSLTHVYYTWKLVNKISKLWKKVKILISEKLSLTSLASKPKFEPSIKILLILFVFIISFISLIEDLVKPSILLDNTLKLKFDYLILGWFKKIS